MSGKPTRREMLDGAVATRACMQIRATGSLTFPAIPALAGEFASVFHRLIALVGGTMTTEPKVVEAALRDEMGKAYAASARSYVLVSYNSATGSLTITGRPVTIAEDYTGWLPERRDVMFGAYADARVWSVARQAHGERVWPPDAGSLRVLDIGAGMGRNALALARWGHMVDAVEMTPAFAEELRRMAAAEAARDPHTYLRVVEGNVFDVEGLRDDYGLIVATELVTDFHAVAQVRSIFELAAKRLWSGGLLLFSAFVWRYPIPPTEATRQLAQHCLSGLFTRQEIEEAADGLPLVQISDDSAYEYEQAHLPEGAWPSTPWFPDWAAGLNVFPGSRDKSPMELRWLVYRRAQ